MANFTKGPWRAAGSIKLIGDPNKEGARNYWVGSVEPGHADGYIGPICSIMSCDHIDGITREEAEANARLIAATPQMFEALKGILAHKPDHADSLWEAVEEALAAATREAA